MWLHLSNNCSLHHIDGFLPQNVLFSYSFYLLCISPRLYFRNSVPSKLTLLNILYNTHAYLTSSLKVFYSQVYAVIIPEIISCYYYIGTNFYYFYLLCLYDCSIKKKSWAKPMRSFYLFVENHQRKSVKPVDSEFFNGFMQCFAFKNELVSN